MDGDTIQLHKVTASDLNSELIDAERENANFSDIIEQSKFGQNFTTQKNATETIQTKFCEKILIVNIKLDSYSAFDDATIKILFKFLVQDWKASCIKRSHTRKKKISKIIEKSNEHKFYSQIINLLNDRKRSHYYNFACQIIYQFVNEWLTFNMSYTKEDDLKQNDVAVDVLENEPDNLDAFLSPLNENHLQLIQLVVVFCSFPIELHETLIEMDDKLKLLYYLRLGRFVSFEKTIVDMLQRRSEEIGNYGKVALEPIVKFHMLIAEKMRLYSFSKVLRRHFPQLDESWTWTIDCNRLQPTPTINNKFEHDLEEIEKESNIKTKKMRRLLNQLLALKTLPIDTFLRVGENRKKSLLESILSSPGMATKDKDFIKIVLDRLDLSKTPEILSYVSKNFYCFLCV